MSSLSISTLEDNFTGLSHEEAAQKYAAENGYIAIVGYKNSPGADTLTNIGTCSSEEEIHAYLSSPYCHDAEILYDGRAAALSITAEFILDGRCGLCEKPTSQASLTLGGGDDFYVCGSCGFMSCDGCYVRLPLTQSPGYGTCPTCRIEVQRAIPGFYGNQSG